MGSIQEGVVGLEAGRLMWIDETKLLNMDFWKMTARLLFIYLMVLAVLVNVDKIVRH